MGLYTATKFFEKNKEQAEIIIKKMESELKKYYFFNSIECIYNHRNVVLTLKIINNDTKVLSTIKIGKIIYDGWFHKLDEPTVNINKTVSLEFLNIITKYASKLNEMFLNNLEL